MGIFHNQCTMYQTHLCHLFCALINLPRFRRAFHRLYPCGYRFWCFAHKEPVAAAVYAGGLEGEDKVVVVLAVEEWHQGLLAGEGLVDEQIFLVVAHGVADIYRLHSPAVTLELVNNNPTEALFVDGIV